MNWTPTQKRQPRAGGQYLVTWLVAGEPIVTVLSFYRGKWCVLEDSDDNVRASDIVAWAELPAPAVI